MYFYKISPSAKTLTQKMQPILFFVTFVSTIFSLLFFSLERKKMCVCVCVSVCVHGAFHISNYFFLILMSIRHQNVATVWRDRKNYQ